MKITDAGSTQKADPILVVEIVRSYVAKNSIAIDEIGPLISTVHRTLNGLGGGDPAPVPQPQTPAVPVQPEYVVCLECGFSAKSLFS
jgi:predicted transcriptional regulator